MSLWIESFELLFLNKNLQVIEDFFLNKGRVLLDFSNHSSDDRFLGIFLFSCGWIVGKRFTLCKEFIYFDRKVTRC